MTELKSISSEFYGEGCSYNSTSSALLPHQGRLTPFQSLETLCFEDLEEWERWDSVKDNEDVESFPKLRELSVVGCPKLSEALPSNLSLLEKLVIRNCPALAVSVSTFPMLCKLEIDECKEIVCSSPTGSKSLNNVTISNVSDFGNWQDFQTVDVLEVKGCDDLINLWQNEIFLEKPPHGLHSLISIRELFMENCKTLTTLLEGIEQKNEHLETLQIRGCHSLKFIFRGQLPPSLKKLSIKDCEKLECLLDDNESSTYSSSSINVNSHSSHLVELKINKCPSLARLPLPDQLSATLTSLEIIYCSNLTTLSLPAKLKRLDIHECPELTTLLPRDRLPETLETLYIQKCGKLESIVERFHNNTALYGIQIWHCNNLKSIPDGIDTLRSLLHVYISECEKLTALPSRIHTLTSLQDLIIFQCPSLSYPEEGFPANLSYLNISSPNLYKPLTNLGFHNLTSLKRLFIHELANAESFHEEEMEMTLPHTLTSLTIYNFLKLKWLSRKSLDNLTSLERLWFNNCPELTSLPNLPSSLMELDIRGCPLLNEAYKRDKGKEWYKIADIPCVEIDGKFIYDPQEESEK